MMKHIATTFCALVVLCAFVAVPRTAEAFGGELWVQPAMFELDLRRGEVFEGRIQVKNNSSIVLPLDVRLMDWTAEERTGKVVFDDQSESRFWYEVDTDQALLDPGETKRILFRIAVPEDAEPGGYYTTILLESRPPPFHFQIGRTRTAPSVGVPFLVVVERDMLPSPGIEVEEFSIPDEAHLLRQRMLPSVLERGAFPLTVHIRNNNPYHVKLSGAVEVFSLFGDKIGETDLSQLTILPFRSRSATLELTSEPFPWVREGSTIRPVAEFAANNFLAGWYYARLSVEAAEGDREQDRIGFWLFPWKTVVVLVPLAVFIVLLRKQLYRMWKTIVSRR